jgi:hypothetical protein
VYKLHSAVLMCVLVGCSEARVEPTVASDAAVDAAVIDTANVDVVTTPDRAISNDVALPDVVTSPDGMVSKDVVRMDAAGEGSLVINEIRASGDEWVEFYNAGTSPVDLSNVQVADTDGDGGARVPLAIRFPAGTMIAPGQYVLVVSGFSDAGVGPQTACFDGGPSTCFHAAWSLSASRGETVWVLSATGQVMLRELYPMNAAPTGQSWGRLPNGTGSFGVNRPTPGAANAAP